MLSAEILLGGVILAALVIYAVTGGADFGSGVWDLFASGPRARAQREVAHQAIGPIWEANHVWLIIVIVLLFVAFPRAFAALGTLLHVPLTLMLFGIVLRGSAFIFRAYDQRNSAMQQRWSLVFSISSVFTPVMLGISLGSVMTGRLPVQALQTKAASTQFVDIYLTPWLRPFPIALGLFVLALFGFLAAVYLTVEAKDSELQGDFRFRALVSGGVVMVLAWICFWLASSDAPVLHRGLSGQWWSWPFQILVGLVALGAFAALWMKRYQWARILAATQVALIVVGWGLAQYPYLIFPHMTLQNSAASSAVLRPVLWILGLGAFLLVPSFAYLYILFKGERANPNSSSH